MADRLFGPMFEPLRDFELFAQVRVDEYGAVVWPNGADLAPDALYQGLIMDRLEDVELNAITDARQDQSIIEVTLDEL